MENIEKNIKLIEKEKQEYLEEYPDEEEDEGSEDDSDEETEEREVDVTEISLDEEEINEWIEKLEKLREEKGQISLEIDDDNDLQINYEEGEDERIK